MLPEWTAHCQKQIDLQRNILHTTQLPQRFVCDYRSHAVGNQQDWPLGIVSRTQRRLEHLPSVLGDALAIFHIAPQVAKVQLHTFGSDVRNEEREPVAERIQPAAQAPLPGRRFVFVALGSLGPGNHRINCCRVESKITVLTVKIVGPRNNIETLRTRSDVLRHGFVDSLNAGQETT